MKVTIKIIKKKKQRKIMELENLYSQMRARNIIRNEEKLKELEAKEKETKLMKDSLGNIPASPYRTIWVRIKNKQGGLKMKCQEDHEKFMVQNAEPDKIIAPTVESYKV